MGQLNRMGRWRSFLGAVSLGTATLVGLSATSGCVVGVRGRASLVAENEPPADQYEAVPAPRSGYVWVRGHWQWSGGQWQWESGHWQRDRGATYVWIDGHWERRGSRYHWVEGYWQASGGGGGVVTTNPQPGVEVHDHSRPAVQPAPPPDRVTVHGHRGKPAPPPEPAEPIPSGPRGYVWIKGYWVWSGTQYEWKKGHWERAQGNQRWIDGHWERQNDDYVWIEGRWGN